MKSFQHFDKTAETFERKAWVLDQAFSNKICEFIKPNPFELVLDVGGGTGVLAKSLKLEKPWILEPSKNMIAIAKRNLSVDARLIIGLGESMPLLTNSFGLVYARNILKHVLTPSKVLNEMIRVAKVGGEIVIIESVAFGIEDKTFLNEVIRIAEPHQSPIVTKEELQTILLKLPLINIETETFETNTLIRAEYLAAMKSIKEVCKKVIFMYNNASETVRRILKLESINGDVTRTQFWLLFKGTVKEHNY